MRRFIGKYWTGIGTRTPPIEIEEKARGISRLMYDLGFTLRSGGADGMDSLFETHYPDNKEIYLPWKKFNKNLSSLYEISPEALELASKHHAAWDSLTSPVKNLMARNCYQALGRDLNTPSHLVICYTWDGCESHRTRTINTGGTGMAIELASLRGIPVINMFNPNWYDNLMLTLDELNG